LPSARASSCHEGKCTMGVRRDTMCNCGIFLFVGHVVGLEGIATIGMREDRGTNKKEGITTVLQFHSTRFYQILPSPFYRKNRVISIHKCPKIHFNCAYTVRQASVFIAMKK
jgi:hypothetical protein